MLASITQTVAIMAFAAGLSASAFASNNVVDDFGSAFMPAGQEKIKMNGTVEGKKLVCQDTEDQDCQAIFDEVFDIVEGQLKKTIKGYIKIKGKSRKNVQFTTVVKDAGNTRMICEYDAKKDKIGYVWADPSASKK